MTHNDNASIVDDDAQVMSVRAGLHALQRLCIVLLSDVRRARLGEVVQADPRVIHGDLDFFVSHRLLQRCRRPRLYDGLALDAAFTLATKINAAETKKNICHVACVICQV